MRVRGLIPGVAAAGVLALPGCGSDDDVRTVTVTAPNASTPTTATTAAPDPDPTTTAPRPGQRPRTTTEPTTVAGTTIETTTVPVTTSEPPEEPAPTTTTTPPGADDTFEPDPIGGTTVARGTGSGTGYTVRIPDGWNDGTKRFEGSSVAFDLTYVKGRGSDVTSNILIVRTTPEGARRRGIAGLAPEIRRELSALAGGAAANPGPRRRIDGEDAVTFVLRRRLGGTSIVQRQVGVVRGRALYTVSLTSTSRSYAGDQRVFARFLDSWRWKRP